METSQRIQDLIESGRVREYAGRCWFTCYKAMSLLSKSQRKNVVMVEGTANGNRHYWLLVNGEVVDVHYRLIDHDPSVESRYDYVSERELSFDQIQLDRESYEEKETFRWDERIGFERVYSLSFKS